MNNHTVLSDDVRVQMLQALAAQSAKQNFSTLDMQHAAVESTVERDLKKLQNDNATFQHNKSINKLDKIFKKSLLSSAFVGATALFLAPVIAPIALTLAGGFFVGRLALPHLKTASLEEEKTQSPDEDLVEQYIKNISPKDRILSFRDKQARQNYQEQHHYGQASVVQKKPNI